MSDHKPAKVSLTALKAFSLHGKDYKEGAAFDVDADQVENLVAQGMAKPTDQVKQEAADAKAAEKAAAKDAAKK